ncbi:DUF3298 domain-containing protein [Metabacillus herbersteinensis]|uniref:DUF3298 domain-containing protein n=1 Tax=Metabacillus herbersteinensis TaxID=283816 RepID=A0ABV6GG75_9BACI
MERFRLPVKISTKAITSPNLSIFYPQLLLSNKYIQQKVNEAIYRKMYAMFSKVNEQGYYQPGVTELLGDFEIKNNQRGIVSLTLSIFANMPTLAHPVNYLDSITTDVRTGKIYRLKDLFKANSDYKQRINELIEEQIKDRDIPLLEPFKGIQPNQKYYIADKSLIIYFDEYDITPGYVGFPMFPIASYKLQDMILDSSPLGIMAVG